MKLLSPIVNSEDGDVSVTVVKPTHALKAEFPILVTEDGIVILVKPSHVSNILLLIDNNPVGMEKLVRRRHPLKADVPILVIEFVTDIFCNNAQFWNAELPIEVIDSGNVIFVKLGLFLNASLLILVTG